MREILFRGKRLDNGEWVDGHLVRAVDYLDETEHCFIVADAERFPRNEFVGFHEVDTETVGQYTGLKDKNGKRIFEGDVVKVDGKRYEVKYMLGQFFVGINMPVAYKRFDCEVVGNIHDNPELMEVAQHD